MKPKSFFTNVGNCARCGKNHKKVYMRPFKNPPKNYSHFGQCPRSNQPILVTICEL